MSEHRANILNEGADSIERNVRCQTHTEANGKNNAVAHLRQLAAEAQPETRNPSVITNRVLSQVLAERIAQDAKWGEQNHVDGTGGSGALYVADRYRAIVDEALQSGTTAWRDVLLEEVYEALAEADPARLRAELVQVAAVCVAWSEAIDRRLAAAEASSKGEGSE